jgi:transcriptional regulator with XRE-family HTH domain
MRLKKNYSQDYIAKKLGISQKAYSKIENNETRLNVEALLSISEILEIPVNNFFGDSKAPMLNDFSSGRDGDNVIYKTINDNAKEDLYQQLLKAKEEIIQAKNNEIETLKKQIEKVE